MMANDGIRWLLRRDIDQILEIEKTCFFTDPWCENDFIICLKQESCMGIVFEDKNNIIGYLVCEFNQYNIEVLKLAIQPIQQRRGFGRHLLSDIKNRLTKKQREFISVKVPDDNLNAQLFFQKNGFINTRVLKNDGDSNCKNDVYLMKFFSKPESFMSPDHPFFPTNRISQYITNW